MKKNFFLFWLLATFFSAFAQEGTLDPAFGNNGLAEIGKEFTRQTFSDDGKLVGIITENGLIKIYRYNNQGSPDLSFGENGVVTVDSAEYHPNPFLTNSNTVQDLAIDHEGRVIVAILYKHGLDNLRDYFLIRYTASGSPDGMFGTNGKSAIIETESPFTPKAFGPIAVQAGNQIIAVTADILRSGYSHHLNVYRVAENGNIDFSTRGLLSDNQSNYYPLAVAIQNNEKIVVEARETSPNNPDGLVLVRLNSDGATDPGFGNKGSVASALTPYHDTYQGTKDMILQSDGKILVKHSLGSNQIALTRFNENGTPDVNFGVNGMVALKTGFWAETLKIQNDDKILIGGVSRGDTKETYDLRNLTLQRLNPNGTPDAFFGNSENGMTVLRLLSVVQSIGIYANRIYTYGMGGVLAAFRLATSVPVTMLPLFTQTAFSKDGKLVGIITEEGRNKVYRYNNDGTPDASFGKGGVVVLDPAYTEDNFVTKVENVAVDNNGQVIVEEVHAFNIESYHDGFYTLTRLTNSGTPDASFGNNGIAVIVTRARYNAMFGYLTGPMAVQSNNEIVTTFHPVEMMSVEVRRINNSGGVVAYPFASVWFYSPTAVAVQDDGKIIVQAKNGGNNPYLLLVRLTSDEGIDPSFSYHDPLYPAPPAGGIYRNLETGPMALLRDGKILVATGGNNLVRFNTDGSPDNSFGSGGMVNVSLTTNKIIVGIDGKIYLGGSLNGDFALARYNADGTLDNSFGNGGIITRDFGAMEGIENMVLIGNTMYVYGNGILTFFSVVNCTPPTFRNDGTIVLDASCTDNDGNISIIPIKGTPPFWYSINAGATYVEGPANGHTFQGLAPGTYHLRLRDANGCESAVVTKEIRKFYGGPLFKNDGTIVLDASCGANDGNISIIPTCGVAPFFYSIDGGTNYVEGPATGYTFQNLAPGSYQLRLKDNYGNESAIVIRNVRPNMYGPCAFASTVRTPPGVGQEVHSASVQVFPNPGKGLFRLSIRHFASPVAQMTVLDAQGNVVQQKQVNTHDGNSYELDLRGKVKGVFLVRFVGSKGEALSTRIIIQ